MKFTAVSISSLPARRMTSKAGRVFRKEFIMATNRTSRQFGRRNAVEASKMAAVALGVIVFGYLAGTLGQYPFPQSNAASAIAGERGNAESGPASGAPDSRVSVSEPSASEPHTGKQGASDLPRECDLRRGIDTACIFN
jgi:hypothetical protein